MTFIYNGTFDGFLSLVHEVYYKKLYPHAILRHMPKTLLLDEIHLCVYDEANCAKVLEALQKNFTKENFQTLLNIFMCDTVAFEMELLEFVVLGFKEQRNLQNINNPAIFKILNIQKEFFRNVHKMSGFLRFEELEDGTLYAKVESKYNLVYSLGHHFSKRFNNQNYIIHDVQRELVFLHSQEFVGIREVHAFHMPTLSQDEQKFKKLWRSFFESVAIQSRKNTKLQQQLVPLIYRTYMNEFYE